MPRITHRQAHRSNPESASVEEYYKRAIVIPFLDHLINEITCRFDTNTKQVASIQGLLPVRTTSDFSLLDIQEAVDFYRSDLSNADVIDEEVHIWKSRWVSSSIQDRPQTLGDSLKVCSPETLPNLFTLLKLFATLPLSSYSCERSASTLRRLNNYLRCSQSEERLSALASVHCNYHIKLDVNHICKLFVEKYPRRMLDASLLFS